MLRYGKRALWAGLLALALGGCGQDLGVDHRGQPVTAKGLDGQWLVLNYWATWCGPCRREIPELNGLARDMTSRGVQVLGVNFDQLHGVELVQAVDSMGISYRVLDQDPAETLGLPSAEGLPVTFILDPRHEVKATLLGEQTAASLRERLQGLGAL
ncbi:TlpA disulfide reductase family protein [Pseudomonas massiliensis]|uniref:TlpA disulfide reductase family protein n=1 Tax=Pseudomonas massiliensis TaxID=522492 RepID=UPI00069453B9|nr:TlpA disulfide reductase family protein [Pseudomonas massiliensis]